MDSKNFTALEIDAIGEMLNISLGASATAVSTMLSARVDITTPVVQILSKDEFEFSKLEPAVGVEITYISGLRGSNIMLLKRHDVKVIVEMLMGMEIPEEEFELNELNISAICEVMNQMMGASSTALSEFLNRPVNISTPVSFEIDDEEEFKRNHFAEEDPMVVIGFTLKIADKLESEFINVMSPSLAKELVSGFLPEGATDESSAILQTPLPPADSDGSSDHMMSQEEIEKLLSQAGAAGTDSEPEPAGDSNRTMSQEEIEKLLSQAGDTASEPEPAGDSNRMMSQEEIEKMLSQAGAPAAPAQTAPPTPQMQQDPLMGQMPQMMPTGQMAPMGQMPQMMPMAGQEQLLSQMAQMQQQILQLMGQIQQSKSEGQKLIPTQKAPNVQLTPGGDISGEQEENRELIMGVPLELSVEIGRTTMLVREILEFTKGSLVILDKLAGEQVDLFVNGRCIAKGDVVVVDDNFGIRITEIMRNSKPED